MSYFHVCPTSKADDMLTLCFSETTNVLVHSWSCSMIPVHTQPVDFITFIANAFEIFRDTGLLIMEWVPWSIYYCICGVIKLEYMDYILFIIFYSYPLFSKNLLDFIPFLKFVSIVNRSYLFCSSDVSLLFLRYVVVNIHVGRFSDSCYFHAD